MKPKTRNLIELNIAALLIAIPNLFPKILDLPVPLIIFGRALFACLALLIFLKLLKKKWRLKRKKDYPVVVGLGLLLAASWLSHFHAVELSTVGIAIIAVFTFPVITSLLEPLLLKEKFHSKDLLNAVLILIGIAVMTPEASLENEITGGILFGLIAAVVFSIRNIFTRKYLKEYSSIQMMAYQTGVAALVLSPVFLMHQGSITPKEWALLLLLGAFFTGVGSTLFIKGMQHQTARTASIIIGLEPVYSILFAAVLLFEIPSMRTLAGGIIIVLASVNQMRKS